MVRGDITIIVPIYNSDKYLKQCIESLINQSYKNLKIILIDDGSSDNSLDIALHYKQKYEIIDLISQSNKGVSNARNLGIKHANSEWISFVDSDDVLEPNAIEEMIKLAEEYHTDCVISNINIIKKGKKTKNKELASGNKIYLNKEKDILIRKFVCKGVKEYEPYTWGIGAPWARIYRLDIIKENKIFFKEELKRMEDGIFNMYYFYYAQSILYTNKCLYNYRVLTNSESHRFNSNIVKETELYFAQLYKFGALFNDEIFKKGVDNQIIRYIYSYMKTYYFSSANKETFLNKIKSFKSLLDRDIYSNAKKNVNYSLLNKQEKLFVWLIVHDRIILSYILIKIREFLYK